MILFKNKNRNTQQFCLVKKKNFQAQQKQMKKKEYNVIRSNATFEKLLTSKEASFSRMRAIFCDTNRQEYPKRKDNTRELTVPSTNASFFNGCSNSASLLISSLSLPQSYRFIEKNWARAKSRKRKLRSILILANSFKGTA